METIPKVIDFKNKIEDLKKEARLKGESSIDIVSLELHKMVGYQTGKNHRMASCCNAMYQMMQTDKGDKVIAAPPKGRGSTLKIRYYV